MTTTTEQISQKAFAQILDRKADGASSKQIWLVAKLILAAGEESEYIIGNESRKPITSRRASTLIGLYS